MATLTTIMVIRTPWHHQRCLKNMQQHLASRTGLEFEIQDFRRETPDRIELDGIRIRHPETGQEVMTIHSITWQHNDHGTVLQVGHPELNPAQIEAAWRLVHERYLCQPDHTTSPTEVQADAVTIGSLTFRSVDVSVIPHPQTVEASVEGTLSDVLDYTSTVHATVVRDRSGIDPATNWSLSTGRNALSCSVLSPYIGWLAALGPEATFRGSMSSEQTPEGNAIDLSGSTFGGVDLSRLAENLPHRVGGRAEVHFDRCRVIPGARPDIAGRIVSREGFLAGTLIAPLAEHFGVEYFAGLDQQRDVNFDLLSAQFSISGDGKLTLSGTCHHQEPYLERDILLCDSNRWLMRFAGDKVGQPTDALRLAYLVTPPQSPSIPMTAGTAPLLRWLEPGGPAAISSNPRVSRLADPRSATPTDRVRQPH